MRELKFRAWDEKEKCWVSGFAIHQSGMFSDWAGCKKINGQCVADADWKYQHEIPHIKIMQYTGLNDKNGVEMYEGDIVIGMDMLRETTPPFKGVIGFKNGSFVVEGEVTTYYRWMDYSLEVIGNIYENPELLKGDENAWYG